MKILIGFLLALFISGHAYAQDYTKTNMCNWARVNLEGAFSRYKSNFSQELDARMDKKDQEIIDKLYERVEKEKKELLLFSTIYKNLDCDDIAPLIK